MDLDWSTDKGKAPVRDSLADLPPRTPPAQTDKYETIGKGQQQRPSVGDAFSEDIMSGAADPANSSNESGDERDPHDLSLSPKHAARTSIVDNMLLSLDQFSAGTSVLDDYRLFNSVLQRDSFVRNSPDSASPQNRYRGDTFSSSLSSDTDAAHDEGGVSHYGIQTAGGRRSNSSSIYHSSGVRGTGSLRGYGHTHGGTTSRSCRPGHGSKSSISSNIDFGNPYSRTRTDSGSDAQSVSLDYEGRTPFPPFQEDYETQRYDDLDAAPTPSVPAGPRKFPAPSQSDYSSSLNPPSSSNNKPPTVSRKNSVTSSTTRPNAPKRKPRPENIGTATAIGLEPPPALDALDPPAPSPTVAYNKPTFPPPPDPNPPKERPGFFRRVFGSSKNSGPNAPSDDPPYPAQDNDSLRGVKPSLKNEASSATITARQVVNKKSSFFRRRKKSVVDSAPPPIPLPQHYTPKTLGTVKPGPSPVSSPKQAMNPSLVEDAAPTMTRSSKEYYGREPSVEDSDQTSASLASQKRRGSSVPPTSGPRAKPGPIPPVTLGMLETSFLANSSGDEASTARSVDFSSPLSPAGGKDSDADSITSPAQPKLAPPTISAPPTALSPVVEDFPQKASASTETPEEPKFPKLSSPGDDSVMSRTLNYATATNTPVIEETKPAEPTEGGKGATVTDREQAQKLFDSQDESAGNEPAAAWLGDPDRAAVREAYMELFDWSNMHILASMRSLCGRLVLKGETQQIDRVLDAFSSRWCRCNPNHGFKAADVVHTICYSLLLLNTDLHLADIDQKMTKAQFVRNTLPTIHRVASDAAPGEFEAGPKNQPSSPTDQPSKLVNRLSQANLSGKASIADFENGSGPLVSTPFHGTMRAWEQQVESVLREFYSSIQKERLPLHGAQLEKESQQNNLLGPTHHPSLRRSPSTASKSGSDIFPRGRSADSRYGTARFASKQRSRARLYPPSAIGSSRTSLDDQSSFWSPSASSTWSKYSLGKLTSVSVDSLGSEVPRGEYQQSIGFANALSQAIIREDPGNSIVSSEEQERNTPLLEDETLQLAGAPWAKEGSLKHKHHLDSVDKRAKDRNWNDCFAVIQQGWMRLFSFSPAARRQQQKKQRQGGSVVVGGGNWLENAEEIWKFILRQTIASALPPPGYSKSRPHVWALSLPTGAVHLFQVGTPEIVREFVSSANYWSARLSKQPLVGGISNIEYGWSDAVINSALIHTDNHNANSNHNFNHNNKASATASAAGPRSSIQSSIRSSVDQQIARPKLPADRVNISDWTPPQQSMVASNLSEEDQLKALQEYVQKTEDEFQRHNERRPAMILAFSPRHPNASKAMTNFEKKSSYLLREIVKFRTYIDSLHGALERKKQIYSPEENPTPTTEDTANPISPDGPKEVSVETPQPA